MWPFLPKLRRFENQEGETDFAFDLPLKNPTPGMSAMVRAKDEEQKIAHCLRSILPIFDEIQVIDNASRDDTASIVRDVKARFDPEDKIRLHSYPFTVHRFGPDNSRTPGDSVHSLAYYTNWSLSRCTRRYVCKWDGDMVLVRSQREAVVELLERLRRRRVAAWSIAGQTVYRGLDGLFYAAHGEVNREVEIFPCTYRCRFHKTEHWEQLIRPRTLRTYHFEPVCFWELKFADEDEFDHWSTTDFPSERKRREWENFHRVREGKTEQGFDVYPQSFLDEEVRPASEDRLDPDPRPPGPETAR